MNNKKVAFVVLSFAIVAALLTMYRRTQMESGCIAGEYCDQVVTSESAPGLMGIGAMPMMGGVKEAEPMMGRETVSITRSMKPGMESDLMYTMPYPGGDDALDVSERVYDRSAYQGVVVSNVTEFVKQVKEQILSVNGKVLSSSQSTDDDMQSAYIMAKVPAEKFDDITGMISAKAKKVMNESINSTDVTGQQVSLSEKMTELQEQKAKKATELAAARTEADKQRIQAELDRIDKQAVQLQKAQERFTEEVQYATISLTVANTERYFNPEADENISGEIRRAWKSLGGTGKIIAHFMVWVIVYAVIWLPIVMGARWLMRKLNPPSGKSK